MTDLSVKRAAIYTRISQADEQVDKPADQESACRQLAARSGYTVVNVFTDDDVSAFEGKNVRKGFQSLVGAIAEGRIDVVMATEPQRFTRGSAAELEALQVACVRAGAVWHTVRAGVQDPSTPMVRAMMQFADTLAWLEVATNRERQQDRNRADRSRGIPKRALRPFGFEVDGMTIREAEAVHIRQAYEAVLTRGATVWQIAQDWNAAGVVTDGMTRPRKNRVTGEKEMPPAVWTTTTVRQLMVRPRNAGLLMHDGAEMPVSQIQPIVSRADWEAVCAALKGAKQQAGPKPQYLLGGLMQCSCGARMNATTTVTARAGKEPRRYKAYRCRLYGFDKSQSHVTIAQPLADGVVRDWIVESIGLGVSATPQVENARLAEIQRRLAQIAAEEERGTDALLEGLGDAARIKGRLKALSTERTVLSKERDGILAESAHSTALSEFRAQLAALEDLAPDAQIDAVLARGFEAWDALGMDKQRAIIRGGYNVRVSPGGRGADRVKVAPSS